MMAITNSGTLAGGNPPFLGISEDWGSRGWRRALLALVVISVALLFPPRSSGAEKAYTNSAAARAEKAYHEAKTRAAKDPSDAEAAWQFGRACFDWADLASGDSQRADIAEHGIEACRRAIRIDRKLGVAHYYLGLNLGQLARTRSLGALKLVAEMEDIFKTAIALDPNFDYAGPHRSLGLLYRDAPGWPASIGNRGNAREQLRKAVELAPEYPDNWLSLLEAYLDWGDRKNAQATLPSAEQALQKAREKFDGPEWKWSWQDWDKRWERIRKKLSQSTERPKPKNWD